MTSAAQQKLKVPIQSNADCVDSYNDLFKGRIDLTDDIRYFSLFSFFYHFYNFFLGLTQNFVQEGKEEKTVVQ